MCCLGPMNEYPKQNPNTTGFQLAFVVYTSGAPRTDSCSRLLDIFMFHIPQHLSAQESVRTKQELDELYEGIKSLEQKVRDKELANEELYAVISSRDDIIRQLKSDMTDQVRCAFKRSSGTDKQ